MNWPGFHAPSAAWLFLLIPPLVLLYFLKLKRPTLQVPSLALWAQVMQDKRVNSPFQRFKQNILLWLQLLILLLLILAAMLPYFHGDSAASRVLILLDRSASMAALDKVGGESRMAAAKTRALDVIDGLSPSQEAAIIAFGRTARQVVTFSNSKRVLRDALEGVETEDVESDLLDALRMAAAMARSTTFDRVLLFSDGNVPANVDFDLPFKLEFEKLPPAGPNLGITGVRARRNTDSGWSVFVRVQGTPKADIPCSLEVVRDGQVLFDQPVHPGRTGQRFVFPITSSTTTRVEIRLKPRSFDSLKTDNQAWLTLGEVRPLRLLVGPRLGPFEHAMGVIDDVEVHTKVVPEVTYDLVVSRTMENMPQARTALHIGDIPADLEGILTQELIKDSTDAVVDWRRNEALLEHVEMGELFLGQRISWSKGVQEGQLDSRRYEVMAYGEKGPLILKKEETGLLRYHILFDPSFSTLPYRVGFPIICRNLVTIAMQRAGILEIDGARTGVLPPLTMSADTEYTVTAPDGSKRVERADSRGGLTGIPAPQIGVYTVAAGGEDIPMGVSLLSENETSLSVVQKLVMNELAVDAKSQQIATDQSLWSMLVMIALGVLLLEWWFFQRRPGGYVTSRA